MLTLRSALAQVLMLYFAYTGHSSMSLAYGQLTSACLLYTSRCV